ncbi:YbaB/EbfC family nucleoid-associated protein [Nocardia sp. CDC159]|uniref:YbaB/EbfC family nucleoid-associated protein n=1 Tax=Nocardia pulmonis TaxID=2951408 RepID=A0A9X2E9G9_9NOCA|nr:MULTISPECIES: YbaB/EbfC family nucleoid-associated protein [Nocardia]MCM6776090.1 YbaB/EbfC family nucleoid-associated protein [Nocardia pulmonis]MCM6788583.1 YbaB/EbfC family nucleoid-associated protein [Nocardia sp. CDC159]
MFETMDELEASVRQRLNRMLDLNDRMTGIRARESSPDDMVIAEVDGNGALLDLELSESISRLSPAEFESALVAAAMAAARAAFTTRADMINEFNEEIKGA